MNRWEGERESDALAHDGSTAAVAVEPRPRPPTDGAEPAAGARPPSMPYNPAIDGLRAVAVLAVLAFHGGFSWMPGGYLGVSTFFTLSGFLITSLIVAERRATGRVDLGRFWARRARRLLPASALTLVAVSLWALVADAQWERNLRGDVLAAVFQVANWRFLVGDRSYVDLFAAPSPVLHFWSLAIEEQFYWVFPLLAAGVLAAARGSLQVLGRVLGLLLAGSLALMVLLGPERMDVVYYATPVRMGEILAGAVLAVAVVRRGPVRAGGAGARAVAVAGALALAASAWAWVTVEQTAPGLYRGGLAIYAAGSVAVVLATTVPGPVRGLLSWAPLRLLGVVSYGVYLAHWPVFLWLDEASTGWTGVPLFAVRVAVTLALAVASYVLVERPVRSGWRPARLPMPALAAGTVAAVALLAAVVPVLAAPPADPFAVDGDLRPIAPSEVPAGSHLAVTLGDSTMLNVAIGLTRWGLSTEDGLLAVHGLGGLGCSIARDGERRYMGEVGVSASFCDDWPTDIPAAAATVRDTYGHADVAVITTGPWDVADRRLPGDEVWRAPGDPVFDAHLRSEIAAVTDAFLAEGLPVVWLTTAHLDVGRMMQPPPPAPFPESDPARVDRLNSLIRQVVAERDGAAVVDLGGYLDDLPASEDARLRPDGVHLERDAAEEVAEWLGPAIIAAVPTRPE